MKRGSDYDTPSATVTSDAPKKRSRKTHERLDQSSLISILGYSLAQANIVMRQVFNEHIGDSVHLRPVEFTVLQLLLANSDVTQTQLARALAMSAPNLTTLLDRLDSRRLLARERSHTDRRAQHIRLTPEGRALARKTAQIARTMEDEALRHLSAAERAMLIELLQRVARHRRS